MDKKYQVFISSTFTDLQEERKSIISTLLAADCIPAGMEAFCATDEAQFDVIKNVIDLCDYYILIIGNRYGSINEKTGISYTEMEYDYAISKNIPVLVFSVENENYASDDEKIKKEKLSKFKEKALKSRLGGIWKSVADLREKVALSIMKAKQDYVRPGWSRNPQYDEATYLKTIQTLTNEVNALKKDNNSLQERISQLTTIPDNLAFEGETIDIEYEYSLPSGNTMQYRTVHRHCDLKELFRVISINMSNVMVTETAIENVVKDYVSPKASFIKDKNTTKILLNQYEALGLVTHKWSDGKMFYGLTPKGEKEKNNLNLIHKFNHP